MNRFPGWSLSSEYIDTAHNGPRAPSPPSFTFSRIFPTSSPLDLDAYEFCFSFSFLLRSHPHPKKSRVIFHITIHVKREEEAQRAVIGINGETTTRERRGKERQGGMRRRKKKKKNEKSRYSPRMPSWLLLFLDLRTDAPRMS